MSDNEPKIAQRFPYSVELKAQTEYHWCACGRSKNQPFCDGSHQGTGFAPKAFTVEKDGTYHLCGCKHTHNPPFCDGTHRTLPQE